VARPDHGLRKLSQNLYQQHRRLVPSATRAFVETYRNSEEWQAIEGGDQASLTACNRLQQRFFWKRDIGTDPNLMPSASEQIELLINEVQKSHSHSVSAMYVAHCRQIGAITARAGVGTWYAPNDELIEALVLANVAGPMELDAFLARLFDRYRIVIGAQEAMRAFDGDLLPVSWTVLSWKIPVMIEGQGSGATDEEIEIQRGADRVRVEAGRGWDDGRRGVPQDGNQRSDLLCVAEEVCGADAF